MNERKLIREFLDNLSSSYTTNKCLGCGQNPCTCGQSCDCGGCEICLMKNKKSQDYNLVSSKSGEAHHEMETGLDGSIPPEELYRHFDLNDDGRVTPQEYADHIEYHAAHPESLDHYRNLRDASYQTVPCKDSYDSCSQHLMQSPDDIDKYLKPLMDCTGSTCRESSTKALLDVLQSLINCGVFG